MTADKKAMDGSLGILDEIITYPKDYAAQMEAYNHRVALLEETRKAFYEANPDFPITTMYINVISPPQKIELRIYK